VARWPADTLALKPDVLSILIGVNDVGHALRKNVEVSIAHYESTYDQLLAETVAALPNVKLVLCEPFLARGKSTEARFDDWQKAIEAMDAVVDKLAIKYHAPAVHFQRMFDGAFRRAPVGYWIWDGVHPTYSGQQLMADEWERAFRAFYGSAANGGAS
jgi:lysophospholipase L1-like esterase